MKPQPMPPDDVLACLRRGTVIPAHPLALTADGKLDERRQRALSRYYLAAGCGGLAVGVHTTQFEIHRPEVGLYRPVLELAAAAAGELKAGGTRVLVAGICGRTEQAVSEARMARDLGYHAGLLNLGALGTAGDDEVLRHCRAVADALPVFGFYLQPATGGRILGFGFWRRFVEIANVVAIKIACFDRYRTLDVIRAVAEGGRDKDIALYTGNDDAIVQDLVTPFRFSGRTVRIVGGLLGHWAFWTRKAVELHDRIRRVMEQGRDVPAEVLTAGAEVTDCNAAAFDSANGFTGCIPGINEMLRRCGLLATRRCVDPSLDLSPGQEKEIDRVIAAYPHLSDADFVSAHLSEWLG